MGGTTAFGSSSIVFARSTTSATHTISGRYSASQRRKSPSMRGESGKNGMKWNRRRKAASSSAMLRSAVFIVPMIHKFSGSENLPSSAWY